MSTISVAPHETIIRTIRAAVSSFAFGAAKETVLHSELSRVLEDAGVRHEREHVAGPGERFDFLCDHGVVVEVKIKGSMSEALRQCARYCKRDRVSAVVLLTTRLWGKQAMKGKGIAEFEGKPVHIVFLGGQAF